MFLGKMALSSKTPKLTLKILNLAIAAVVVGITGLVWLGPDAAEAAGRKVTLTWNEIITPSATTTTPFSAPPGKRSLPGERGGMGTPGIKGRDPVYPAQQAQRHQRLDAPDPLGPPVTAR